MMRRFSASAPARTCLILQRRPTCLLMSWCSGCCVGEGCCTDASRGLSSYGAARRVRGRGLRGRAAVYLEAAPAAGAGRVFADLAAGARRSRIVSAVLAAQALALAAVAAGTAGPPGAGARR